MGNFNELIGRRIVDVEGLEPESEGVSFVCEDGTKWLMAHSQDCCESVSIVDIVGDPNDAIGLVIDAREESDDANVPDYDGYYDDSHTWTFYVLQTDKGALTIRWLGQSNGYYSESVDFDQVTP